MLVVVLGRADHRLPSSVYELYQLAIDTCLDAFAHRSSQRQLAGWKERVLEGVLAVAHHNHVRKERLFDYDFGKKHSDIWEELCACGATHSRAYAHTHTYADAHTHTHTHTHTQIGRAACGERVCVPV